LILFSLSLLPPLGLSWYLQDGELRLFSITLAASLGSGLALWLPFRRHRYALSNRDGFVIVTMFWFVLSLLSALPFTFSIKQIDLSDAVFEAVSAFSTTGATVIVGLDSLPRSLLFFRQELQWLGGIGVVVAAVAILPMLGVGGMQLYRAETPGPMKDEKLTPRITHTARRLWIIYGILTAACTAGYWWAGMTPFEAIAHSLSTVSTGGFSTHDASLAYYDSFAIEAVAMVFMVAGAVNFSIHYMAMVNRNPWLYLRNIEIRFFLLVIILLTIIVSATLVLTSHYADPLVALRYAGFEVISVLTSTGFGIDDFSQWPLFLPILLIFSSFMGGCAGSTSGGMKTIRFLVLGKQSLVEINRLVHPRLIQPIKLGNRVIPDRIVSTVWAFVVLYAAVFCILMLGLMVDGMDAITAFGAVASCMNNLGPGLGEVSASFASVSDYEKYLLSFAMLAGRLEVFTLLVLFSPAFWRR